MVYTYEAERLGEEGSPNSFWWPVSSDPDNKDIVGDGIPGDKNTAEFAAECCNILYKEIINQAIALMKKDLLGHEIKPIKLDIEEMVTNCRPPNKEAAEFAIRCCDIVQGKALEDVINYSQTMSIKSLKTALEI